jgi:H+/Cl- antiporter ClcA
MLKFNIQIRFILFLIIVGVGTGLLSSLFLLGLEWATTLRQTHFFVMFGLPLSGMLIVWLYQKFGEDSSKGVNLILDEIENNTRPLPKWMGPLVFIGTISSHLFGASVGREGTAVQLGSSFADSVAKFFKVSAQEKKILLLAGLGAGFGSAIGVPMAGTIFGMEVMKNTRTPVYAFWQCALASFIAYFVSDYFTGMHIKYPLDIPELNMNVAIGVVVLGLMFGVVAKIFILLHKFLNLQTIRMIQRYWLRPLIGGVVILFLFALDGSFRYTGLGLDEIKQAFVTVASWKDPLFKLCFTLLALSFGFKGGEFTPLVFIGATLGSFMSVSLNLPVPFAAALGLVAVFAAASNAPIACALMGIEIFGLNFAPYALIICSLSYYVSGKRHSIYM